MNSTYNKITNNIYIGNMWSCKTVIDECLKNNTNKITHVVSLIPQPEVIINNLKKHNIIYYEHSFNDSINENIVEHFNIMFDTLEMFVSEKNNSILIMCQAGKSRSVSIAILTLINFYNMTFVDAFNLISSKRETQINRRFYNDLLNYKNK
jgi:protein-tyrosine phosphatase